MPATVSADFNFTPKVWQDHIMAYFDRKLVYGAFALRDDSLAALPGLTQNFPYFKKIGSAENPSEDEGLLVDSLTDDSFNVTVAEVSKAVGVTKKAFKTSAARMERIVSEIQEQIGRVFAEKVDADLYTAFSSSYTLGYQSGAGSTQVTANAMNIRNLNLGKVKAFGDKHKDSVVIFMHSLQFLDIMQDQTAGFLVANALDPMFMVEGYEGKLGGVGLVTVDTVGKNTAGQINGHDAYDAWIHKANAYGFMVKQDMELEHDYDILHRQWVFAGDQWYGCRSFDQTIDPLFKKTVLLRTITVNGV
jgi:hypothetical protein